MGPNKCIFPQSAEIQYICWLTGIVEPKKFWKSDRCWEPRIPKFECYWKLWKLGRVGLKIALSLYNGTFGDQMTKWGQNYSFPHSAYTMVHLVAHLTWPSGKVGQKLQFSTISMYNGTFGGPLTKWCQKFHFSLSVVNIRAPSAPYLS